MTCYKIGTSMNLLFPALLVGVVGLLGACVVLLIWLLTDRPTSPTESADRRIEDATTALRRTRFRRLGLTVGAVLALLVAVLPSLGRPDLGRSSRSWHGWTRAGLTPKVATGSRLRTSANPIRVSPGPGSLWA